MSKITQAGEQTGEWDVQSRDYWTRGLDILFAPDELGDTAISAAIMAGHRWRSPFPGWEVYRTVVNGTDAHWLDLVLYSRGMGEAMANSRSKMGRRFVRLPHHGWVAQAAEDAMFRCVHAKFPQPATRRAEIFGIDNEAYSRLRNTLAGGFINGLENYRGLLWSCVSSVIYIDKQQVA